MERVVIITGAASGIGAATAARLAAPETALLLTTRGNAEGLARAAEQARSGGAAVATILADLADADAAHRIHDAARSAFGRVDQIVCNAGKAQKTVFGAFDRSDLEAAFGVNTTPFLDLVTVCLEDLKRSEWGRVVAMSSFVANDFGVNDTIFPATAAAKAALEALAKALAIQLAPSGVCVNCVAPGYTRKVGGHAALSPAAWEAAATATPMRRIADPEDVAAAVAFLLSRGARHITGPVLRVDGGLSLL